MLCCDICFKSIHGTLIKTTDRVFVYNPHVSDDRNSLSVFSRRIIISAGVESAMFGDLKRFTMYLNSNNENRKMVEISRWILKSNQTSMLLCHFHHFEF